MVTKKELYKKIVKELRKYDKAVKLDREEYDRETNSEYRKGLNMSGMEKSRSKAAQLESRMKSKSDELRQRISKLINSAISENYPKETLRAADLDDGLVNMLNAGFAMDTSRLKELYTQYNNYTCHQLIRDYAERNNIILPVEEDRNAVLAKRDRDNFNGLLSTFSLSSKIIDADSARSVFAGAFGIDNAQDEEITEEVTRELQIERWNKENGYTQWSQE